MTTSIISGSRISDTSGQSLIQLPSIDNILTSWLGTINNFKTREAYRYGVARVIKCGNDSGKKFPWPLGAATLNALHKDVRYYVQEGLMKAATGNQSKTALTNLFNYLVLYQYIPLSEKIIFDTMPEVRMPKDRGERKHKYVPHENILEAIDSANDRDKVLLEVLYLCGFRAEEVVELKGRSLYRKDGSWEMEVRGKEGSIRHVPVPDVTARNIMNLHYGKIHDDMPLFGNVYKPHLPIGTEAVRQMMKRLFGKCGIEEPTPHWFRATFATDHLIGGKDVNVVQDLLGHSKAETTLRYLVEYLMDQKKKEAISSRSV